MYPSFSLRPSSLAGFRTLGAILLLAWGASVSAAVIRDDFSGTYPSGGNGWTEDWAYRHYRTTSPDSKAEYRSADPLPGSANYLNVRYVYNVSSSGGYSIVSRPFSTEIVDNSALHRVSFDFRLDDATHWNHTGEQIAFFAASTKLSRQNAVDAATTNSWGLNYNGVNGWSVVESDGAGGIRYVTPGTFFGSAADGNTVYNITLEINPGTKTFSVSISDGNRTETWNNTAFAFINPNATASGQHLHFYAHARYGVSLEYSIANLQVDAIPEPGAVALVTLGLGGFALRRRMRGMVG